MKKIAILLLLIISFTSCKARKSNTSTHNTASTIKDSITENLLFMNESDSLTMFFQDEKCGEWGGNTNAVLVYKIYNKKLNRYFTFMDVMQRTMNCDSVFPENNKQISFQKKHIHVNARKKKMIGKSIKEITQKYLTKNHRIISNSGCFSSISSTNETMLIRIYPSPPWKSFFELIKEVKRN